MRGEERQPQLGRIMAQDTANTSDMYPVLKSHESLDEGEWSGEKLQAGAASP